LAADLIIAVEKTFLGGRRPSLAGLNEIKGWLGDEAAGEQAIIDTGALFVTLSLGEKSPLHSPFRKKANGRRKLVIQPLAFWPLHRF
jgi:hypothetical protein